MKPKLFVIYCSLFIALCPLALSAQNGITISDFSAKAGSSSAPSTVTFKVEWKPLTDKVWSDTAWVFIDYNNAGTMTRLPLAPGATLTAHSAPGTGKVMEVTGNTNGVWVVGNARTNSPFSATVQLLTAATATFHGACVYAINYPPVGQYEAYNKIRFTGTPPFELKFEGSSSVSIENKDSKPYTVSAGTLSTFTDASKAPGLIKCKTPAAQTLIASALSYCAGSGVTLALSGTDNGAIYQLYLNNAPLSGATLTGNGSPATFSGTFNAGTYTAQVAKTAAFCAATMSGTPTITVNPLPGAPTGASANARCGNGAVSFQATTVPGGCTIDWYNASANGSIVSSATNPYTPSNLTATTTYYAQARNTSTSCVSATRLAVTATVNPVPNSPTVTAGSRCGNGTVTLSASLSGATIDWYSAANGGTLLLSGNNNYTTPSINANTNYFAQARISATGCTSTARSQVTATVNTIPAAPSGASANARCGNGAVSFQATTVPGGCTIDWYTASAAGSIVSSATNPYTPSNLTATTTYYAQARNTSTSCISATRLAVTATVNPATNLSLTAGSATVTAILNYTSLNIQYKANNAAGVSRSDGSFPPGVNGSLDGSVFTISGTPSQTGTFNYKVTTSNNYGCPNPTVSGQITVNEPSMPTNAETARTWSVGSYTWSDRLFVPSGALTPCTYSSTINTNKISKSYSNNNGVTYVQWNCASDPASSLCNSGWTLPFQAAVDELTTKLTNEYGIPSPYHPPFNWDLVGWMENSYVKSEGIFGALAYLTDAGTTRVVRWTDAVYQRNREHAYEGFEVRCVYKH
jgi:hypothetical protein